MDILPRVFLWNVFPFHPFEEADPMSNRRHSAREFNACKDLLCGLLGWLRPKRIVALGADAHNAVLRLGFEVFPVRHPSYGGHIEFAGAIRKLYSDNKKDRWRLLAPAPRHTWLSTFSGLDRWSSM